MNFYQEEVLIITFCKQYLGDAKHYICHEWFGGVTPNERRKYRTAITKLERDGYVTTCTQGRRFLYIKTTPKGEATAKNLIDFPTEEKA
jgi:hypothetical protein